ncbi:fatty acyl-CoA reductase wat [Drosophila willistoni]|uniref:fatty acyl-CoA reductase wat n=1 Tax=Drosophila willistoni TaxID=7260 RepID=UPI000C26C8AD|nr:fatty acyl-CoA reductase wat [Drosophila willistoni]XP_046869507.1 fatty acyl-CoA reductase wat [Drosophila willistoni]
MTSAKPDDSLSDIQKFFYGANVFITGATGFLGKILLYKLFTSCPAINAIYILIRNKKGKTMDARLEEIFKDPVFNKTNPKIRYLIKGISGDCSKPGLGLSSGDRKILTDCVNIVFHMAATVRFDEKLRTALRINVGGAYETIKLCRIMTNLRSVVHVSTAYTQCPLKNIDEKFYPMPNGTEVKRLLLMAECIPDNLFEHVTPVLLGKWPNTYTFTKAVAEDVVRTFGASLPVGVFRPGIVISTYQEPVGGWIDNFYGPTGAIAGAATGIIRTLRCDPHAVANMVPVDMCVNSLIASSWDIFERQRSAGSEQDTLNIPVYNFCAALENQLTWGDFTSKTTKYGLMYPTMKAIWYLCYSNTPNRMVHGLSIFILHYLPALMFDTVCLCFGRKPKLMKTYKKIHRFMTVISYFSLREWNFQVHNVQNLWSRMTKTDKNIFFFDMRQLDWDLFLQQYLLGIRQYLLNDPLETIPKALVRWNRLYCLHCGLKLAIICIILYLGWRLI